MAVNAPYEMLDLTRTNRVPLHSSIPANTASNTTGYCELDRRREGGSSGPTVPAGERYSTHVTDISPYVSITDDNKKTEEIKSGKKYSGGIQITLLTVIIIVLVACFIGVFFQGAKQLQLTSQLNERIVSDLHLPIPSCAALPPSSPSGYYWVRASEDSAVRVYCDMTRTCGNVTGGWTRVGYLDMTQNSQQCPSVLKEHVELGIRTCVSESDSAGCTSVFYVTTNINYSRVCGRVTGYQIGSTDAFATIESTSEIDSPYVDGVSLTRGNNPRQHIWTFAAGFNKRTHMNNCPCQTSSAITPQNFVAKDYFCDSGNGGSSTSFTEFFTDPLWDGTDCTCCNNPPWFYKQLPQPTTDDIEMRLCTDQARGDEDIAIQLIEIYIQ